MSELEAAFCRSRLWRLFARRIVLPWALQGRSLSGDVLEIGAGNAAVAAGLLAANPNVRLTATDFDQAMVSQAEQTLAPFGERARVERVDATALPYPDGSFDAALSFLMLHHVGRWEQALGELVRVLRPEGELFVYDILDNAPARLIHSVTRSPGVRLIRVRELEAWVGALALEEARLHKHGVLFRLLGRKPASDLGPRARST